MHQGMEPLTKMQRWRSSHGPAAKAARTAARQHERDITDARTTNTLALIDRLTTVVSTAAAGHNNDDVTPSPQTASRAGPCEPPNKAAPTWGGTDVPKILNRTGGILQWSPELADGHVQDASGMVAAGLSGMLCDHPARKKTQQRSGGWPKVITEKNMTAIGHNTHIWGKLSETMPTRASLHDENGKHMATVVALPYAVLAEDGNVTMDEVRSELLGVAGLASGHKKQTSYTQLAGSEAGQYMEAGWGVTPGSSRKATVATDGASSFVPFWTADSEEAEKSGLHDRLQLAVARAADTLEAHYPDLLASLNSAKDEWPELAEALSYPRPLPDRKMMYGNKVAVRATGVGRKASKKDIRRMHHTNCDLHYDPLDARRLYGSVLMYAWLMTDPMPTQPDGERQPHTDLLVFTSKTGGRCWRIQTAVPNCVVLVFCHSDQLLHCNPYPDTLRLPCASHKGWVHLRLVLYALTKIDNLIHRLAADKTRSLAALLAAACPMLKRRLNCMAHCTT